MIAKGWKANMRHSIIPSWKTSISSVEEIPSRSKTRLIVLQKIPLINSTMILRKILRILIILIAATIPKVKLERTPG